MNSFKVASNDFVVNDGSAYGGTSAPVYPEQTSEVAKKVNQILNDWVGPLFTAVGAIGSIYIIILAVQYARSENDSKRAEVKTRMVNCAIGVVALLVIASLCLFVDWQGVANIFGYVSRDYKIPE